MAFDQKKYISDYNNKNIKYRKISFNEKNPEDKAIMEWIDSQDESTSSYLKRLVINDMGKREDKKMTKQFVEKVIKERIVDTKAYRYVVKECYNHQEQWLEIRRLPIEQLDTTAAIDGWETVKVIK